MNNENPKNKVHLTREDYNNAFVKEAMVLYQKNDYIHKVDGNNIKMIENKT